MLNNKSNFNTAQADDLVELVSTKGKYYIFKLENNKELQTHRGVIKHNDLIGKKWGSEVFSHRSSSFYLLKPGLYEWISSIKRNTQIMYPKDIGYILLKMNIIPGTTVIEAGTGSGSFTHVLATYLGESGHLYSYDKRKEVQNLAEKNILRIAKNNVTFINQDIVDGFAQTNVDAIFLDLPNPYDYLEQVIDSLKSGGYFGTLLPTTNQVNKILIALEGLNFNSIDVCEMLLRFYQADSSKLRPVDRMVAHTGYLVFARSTYKE